MSSVEISVVVCTYNRARLLERCLRSLGAQTLEPCRYEVIVVDNNSTDSTRRRVEELPEHARVCYTLESRQGLSYARNRGLELARGRYVAYIDDDALASPSWLEEAYRLIFALPTPPDCLGGPILPIYSCPKPAWFKDCYETRRDWGFARYLRRGESFSGSNQIWRKDSLTAIGGFNPHVGVTSDNLVLGEDTAVFQAAWSAMGNPQFYYSPSLIVHHWVPVDKMTVSYQVKRQFAIGQARSRLSRGGSHGGFANHALLSLLAVAKGSARALLRIGAHRRWQNWIVEEWAPAAIAFGELLGSLGIFPRLRRAST